MNNIEEVEEEGKLTKVEFEYKKLMGASIATSVCLIMFLIASIFVENQMLSDALSTLVFSNVAGRYLSEAIITKKIGIFVLAALFMLISIVNILEFFGI